MSDVGPSHPGHRSAGWGQAGFSLAETLVAIAVASIWVLALVLGLLVVTTSDASSAARQGLASALAGTTGVLKQAPYLACGGDPAPDVARYEAELGTGDTPYEPPAGVTVRVTRVQHWDPPSGRFVAACPAVDGGAQRITVEAVDGRGGRLTAQVVKARP
jgi:hypothetical protein